MRQAERQQPPVLWAAAVAAVKLPLTEDRRAAAMGNTTLLLSGLQLDPAEVLAVARATQALLRLVLLHFLLANMVLAAVVVADHRPQVQVAMAHRARCW